MPLWSTQRGSHYCSRKDKESDPGGGLNHRKSPPRDRLQAVAEQPNHRRRTEVPGAPSTSSGEEPSGRPEVDAAPFGKPLESPSPAGLHPPERRPRPLDGGLGSGSPRAARRRRAPVRGEGGGVAGVGDGRRGATASTSTTAPLARGVTTATLVCDTAAVASPSISTTDGVGDGRSGVTASTAAADVPPNSKTDVDDRPAASTSAATKVHRKARHLLVLTFSCTSQGEAGGTTRWRLRQRPSGRRSGQGRSRRGTRWRMRRSWRFGASPSQMRTLGAPGTATAATAMLGQRRRPRRVSSAWMKSTGSSRVQMQENWLRTSSMSVIHVYTRKT